MKKLISLLTALALCFGILGSFAISASAANGDEIRAAKKIISVVYDDSGSMYGDRWVYANYAMQALTALLNEQDELYMTYMSRPSSSNRVDLTNISGAVKDIRNWAHSSGTPGESLDTAKDRLDGISESDSSTQFWLVILTDGDIDDLNMTLQAKLDSFKGARMSNGSSLNVAYLAMGSGAVRASADTGKGLYTYDAADSASITTTMSKIANLISGRITADDVKQVDEKTISFRSDLPLYSVSILSQGSSATVTAASSTEQTLNVNRNIPLNAFEPFKNTDLTLSGNATVINREDGQGVIQIIQADTYTVTFSEPVSKDDLVVQYEPAIGLKMILTRGGVEITDPSALLIDDKVSVEMIPVVPGTDERIDSGSLPRGISWKLEFIVDDHIVDSANGAKLPGMTIREGEHVIRGIMQIPGFAPSFHECYFRTEQIVYNFGIRVDQPDPLSYYRKHSGDSIEGGCLTFCITNDGTALSKAEQKSLGVKLEVIDVTCDNSGVTGLLNRFGTLPAECSLKQCDDGSYILTPNPVVPFTAFLTMAGDYVVTVAIDRDNTITATGKFSMIAQLRDWIDLSWLLLILLLLCYLIYIIFIKYKFTGQTVCYTVYKPRGDGGGIELVSEAYTATLRPISLNLLLPTRACEMHFYGLTLQAGPDGSVIVTGKSIAKAVDQYGASSARPTTALHSIAASLRSTQIKVKDREERRASDMPLTSNRPIYFRSEGSRNIWCIHLQ